MIKLSVCIPCINESQELNATLRSIRDTAGDRVDVVVCDDCSSTKLIVDDPSVTVVHNRHRIGSGASRYLAAQVATGDYIMITDAHMRFLPGWYEQVEEMLEPKTVLCGSCLGLDADHMDPTKPLAKYYGATFKWFGPDQNPFLPMQVFEAVWKKDAPEFDIYTIPCCLGACYFVEREWFLKLGAMRYFRSFGIEEQSLSLKAWLSGGKVLFAKHIEFGHRFRKKNEKLPFGIPTAHLIYNKIFCLATCLPKDKANFLISKLPGSVDFETARKMIAQDWHLVAIEQEYNRQLFTRSFDWFTETMQIPFPHGV